MFSEERGEQFLHKIEGGLASAAPFLLLAMPVMCQVGWWSYYEIPFALFGLSFYVAALWLCGYGFWLGAVVGFAKFVFYCLGWVKKRGRLVSAFGGWVAIGIMCFFVSSFLLLFISINSNIIPAFLFKYGFLFFVLLLFLSMLFDDELKEEKFWARVYIIVTLNFDRKVGGEAAKKINFHEWCGILFLMAAMAQTLGYCTAAYYKARLPVGGDGLAVGVFGENIIYRKVGVGGGYIFKVKAATSAELVTGAVKP